MAGKASPLKAINSIYQKEGVSAFYKGLPIVVTTMGMVNAVVFSAYE